MRSGASRKIRASFERARRLGASVPRHSERACGREPLARSRSDDDRTPRGEQAALDERILADQRIAAARLADDGEIDVAREAGEVARELLGEALHQTRLRAQSRTLGARLEALERRFSLRLGLIERVAHVGESHVGAIERQKRLRRERDADEVRLAPLGERDRERHARCAVLGAVNMDDDVVQVHRSPNSLGPFILAPSGVRPKPGSRRASRSSRRDDAHVRTTEQESTQL